MMNCRVWLLFGIIMFPVKQSTSVFHLTAQISFSTSRCYLKLYFAVPSKNHLTSNLSFFSDSELSSRVSRTRALAMSSADSWPQDRCQVIYTYIRFISISTTKNVVVWSCCAICWCQMKHPFEQAFSPSGWCIHSIGDWCSPNPWRQKDSSNSVSKRKDSKINHVINPEIMTPTLHASAPRAVSIAARSLACTCFAGLVWHPTNDPLSKGSDVEDKSSEESAAKKAPIHSQKAQGIFFWNIPTWL